MKQTKKRRTKITKETQDYNEKRILLYRSGGIARYDGDEWKTGRGGDDRDWTADGRPASSSLTLRAPRRSRDRLAR